MLHTDTRSAPVEESEEGQVVLRMVGFMAPVTTDEIAAAGVFEGRGRLLPEGIVYLLAQRGFVTRRLLSPGGARDVYVVEPTEKGQRWVDEATEAYFREC